MEAKGHASGVTLGRSPRMLSARRIIARGGGARTKGRGEAEHARSLKRASGGSAPPPPAIPAPRAERSGRRESSTQGRACLRTPYAPPRAGARALRWVGSDR